VTCSDASSQSARKPIDERSESGSSRCQISRERSSGSLRRSTSSSWWLAPSAAATRRASPSSESSPAKPTANVYSGSVMWRAISATMRLESRPPLSIAPSGTSLISRIRTDSSSLSSTISAHSAAERGVVSACGTG
jgi:hypothetical protein